MPVRGDDVEGAGLQGQGGVIGQDMHRQRGARGQDLAQVAGPRGIEVLVEIHTHYEEQIDIARQVDWVYDFALPPLILHTLYTGNTSQLKHWLEISPRNAVTVLDTHDGIGVLDVGPSRKDLQTKPGLLTPAQIDRLVETIHERSGGASRQATGAAASNLDLYQVNCTFYDALGRRDDEYLLARALQFFAPGIPQVYYVGLLAGMNDIDLLRRTGVGRDINRHYFTVAELEERLKAPVVRSLFDLIRFRNVHPAFAGEFRLPGSDDCSIAMEWRNDSNWARLDVDLAARSAVLSYSDRTGDQQMTIAPSTAAEAHP